MERNRFEDALAAINEALRLEPEDADYHSLQGSIYLNLYQWRDALESAEQGLRIDSEHVGCTNLRAIAMVKLGRRKEAGATIDAALARNPENSITHANQGWTYLEAQEPDKAAEHFREALRLDPTNEWARQGIVEALKARYFIYSVFLRWFLWMSKLSPTAQWGVILGGYFAQKILLAVVASNPALGPIIWPVLILYFIFVLMTWIAAPLFNLILRLNRFGRLVLSREETVAANWFGACMFLAFISLAAWAVTQKPTALLGAIVFGTLLVPLAGTFGCPVGWPRIAMASYTGLMALAGLAVLVDVARAGQEVGDAVAGTLVIFLVGAFLSTWISNALRSVRPRR